MTVVFINPDADGAVYLSQNLDHITVTFLPFVQKIFTCINRMLSKHMELVG